MKRNEAIRGPGGPRRGRRWLGLLLQAGSLAALPACGGEPPAPAAPGGPEIQELPPPRPRGGMSLEEAILRRRSVRSFGSRELSREEWSRLFWAAQGVTEPRRGFRAAPSAGATFPLRVYGAAPCGLYLYHPEGHRLERRSAGDLRAALSAAALGQGCVRDAPLVLVFCALEERTTGRYGERGRMYIHMEAGHAAQNVHLQAVALGLGSVPVGAFDPARVAGLLGLPAGETVLYLVPVGEPAGAGGGQ